MKVASPNFTYVFGYVTASRVHVVPVTNESVKNKHL